jgi:AcrR family transcriptional regulator
MPSERHKRTDDDAVLDAVRECVLAVGVRRTTLTDIARRAGVSRMTLYRRWPDARTLVGDLMTREWLATARAARPADTSGPTRKWLVEALVRGVVELRDHPLLRKIIEVDPERLLPYVTDRLGASQLALLETLEQDLRAGHADGSIRRGDPALQARALLLITQSFTLSARTMTGDGAPGLGYDAFDAELARILERTLAP